MTAARDVRPAGVADADAIAAVHVTTWQHAYAGARRRETLGPAVLEEVRYRRER